MHSLYKLHQPIPSELIRKILTVVLADCVFTVCRSASNALWEMNAAGNLSLVSFAFREIVREIVTKAFEITELEQGQTVISTLGSKLVYLRNLGISSHGEARRNQAPTEPAPERVPLIQAYSLWLTSVELREQAASDANSPSVFVFTHETILRALDLSWDQCGKVHPRRMAFPLLQALERNKKLVQTARELVQARMNIHKVLGNMQDTENQSREENIRLGDCIKLAVHECLSVVERADLFNTESPSPFMTDFLYRTHQLPPLVAVIHRCEQLRFDLDEYDIVRRVQSFLNSYESHEMSL